MTHMTHSKRWPDWPTHDDGGPTWCRRLVLGWASTVSAFNSRCRTFISVCNQPRRSTQPGHPFVSRHSEYQPKGGDALRLGNKGRCEWQVKPCDPLVTHGLYLTALEINGLYLKRGINLSVYLTLYSASALLAVQTAVLARVILSVRPSVRPSFAFRCFVQRNEGTIVRFQLQIGQSF